MPPKLNTKKDKVIWCCCDKCGRKMMVDNIKKHENQCNIEDISYIENEKLEIPAIDNSLPPDIESTDIPQMLLEKYIFIPESICILCNFILGSYLAIEVSDHIFIKTLWTIIDSNTQTVHCSCKDVLQYGNNPLKIWKLSDANTKVHLCSKLNLYSNIKNMHCEELKLLLKAKLKDTVINPCNTITVDFYNKTITFKVKTASKMLEESVENQLSSLNINENQLYLIDSSTKIDIAESNKDSNRNTENIKKITLNEIGGMQNIIEGLKRVIDLALGCKITSQTSRISRGAIVYGLPGTGKTSLCNALVNSYPNCHVVNVCSWKIFSKFMGESEANLKKCFQDAYDKFPMPTIIVIDEIYNLCPKNDNSDIVQRISTLFINILDSMNVKHEASKLFILANTNQIDKIDPGIKRSGRLDLVYEISVPDKKERLLLLEKLLIKNNIVINCDDMNEIAKQTHGFVVADIENLIVKTLTKVDDPNEVTVLSILRNLCMVKPSAMRELLIEKPDVKWSDIGGQSDLKLKLKQIVEWPIQYPETFIRLGIKAPRGLLMYGPPGCSKTMIAKALANESNLNFISIKGSDMFSMFVGESEKAVRNIFIKARQLSPCIIFFDEIDAICGERSSDSGSSVKERVLAQILTEIDGVHTLKDVVIIAATNRPDLIDSALMRPGRLDRIVYVKLPNTETRKEILKIKLAKIPISNDVDVNELVMKTEGYSGAEIDAMCKEAALKALEESFDIQEICMRFFNIALDLIQPRTDSGLLKLYENYAKSTR